MLSNSFMTYKCQSQKSQTKRSFHFINWSKWHLKTFRFSFSTLMNQYWQIDADIRNYCVDVWCITQRINWQNVWTEQRSSSYRHDLYVHWTRSHTELHKTLHIKPDSVLVYGQHLTCHWIATWAFGCLVVCLFVCIAFDSEAISCSLCHYSNEYASTCNVLMCWSVC